MSTTSDSSAIILYAATSEDVSGGEYYGPSGFKNMRGAPELQTSNEASYDEKDAKTLWKTNEEITGVSYADTL